MVALSPGGSTRINPLDDGPGTAGEAEERRTLRRAGMVAALAATVLDRPLSPIEDAAVFATVEHLGRGRGPATLTDLAGLLVEVPPQVAEALRRSSAELAGELGPLGYAIDKLVSRSLRGMFDGASTVALRWDGPGIVVDLSAVPIDSEALPLVMVAVAGWLSQLMAGEGPQRVQVIDEAWALLGNRHTARYLQTCFKLGRSYGVANLCIAHRPSDLGAQADDGTATAKIAAGLLADSATKILLRQAPDQLATATTSFGLTGPEAHIVGQLARGRALWKVAGRSAVVQHMLGEAEVAMCDTDAKMAARQAEQAEAA